MPYGLPSGKVTIEILLRRRPEVRLLDDKEALAPFRDVWERVRPTIPGLSSRSDAWWSSRRLGDFD